MKANLSPILEEGIMDARAPPWAIKSTPFTTQSRLSHQENWYYHRRTPSTPRTTTLPSTTNNIKTISMNLT